MPGPFLKKNLKKITCVPSWLKLTHWFQRIERNCELFADKDDKQQQQLGSGEMLKVQHRGSLKIFFLRSTMVQYLILVCNLIDECCQ